MKLFEIAAQYHEKLAPDLWDGESLKKEVRGKLLEIADEFIKFIEVEMDIKDIILTGSSANYNYNERSDIDLHIVIDMKKFEKACEAFTKDFFKDKKTLFNERYNIKINNRPVEVYVQDVDEEHIASGVYSLKKNKWLIKPKHTPPEYDKAEVKKKADEIKKEIEQLLNNKDTTHEDLDKVREKITKSRKTGLAKSGEFNVDNLVFKELRNSGHIKKLVDRSRDLLSKELSL